MIRKTLTCCLAAASLLSADTLVLRNGSRIDGTFMGGDSRSVRFASNNQVKSFYLGDVDTILFSGDSSSSSNSSSSSSRPSYAPLPTAPAAIPSNNSQYGNGGAPQSQNTPDNTGLQIPAGTTISVRLIDPVDSDMDRLGQTYRASVDQPVIINGQTVIPRGTDAVAVLTNAQKGGRIEGRTSLTLDLRSITFNGSTYDLQTGGVTEQSGSRGQRSAKVIGGTAALGAIIGAIAGGGKGAAIGTVAGAGAGTAAEVATSGPRVKIPSETRLTFTLSNPLNL